MRSKQQSFNKHPAFKDHSKRSEHGGGLRVGKRKLYRPFDSKKCLHLTLRSSKAKGTWSFLKTKHEKKIYELVLRYAQRSNVKIIRYANAGNHLHILLKARSKSGFQKFLRTTTGMIPRLVAGAQKGNPIGKFWDELAYTKIVEWGRQFKNTLNYVFKNALEAYGIIPARHEAIGHTKIDYDEWFET